MPYGLTKKKYEKLPSFVKWGLKNGLSLKEIEKRAGEICERELAKHKEELNA